MGESRNIPLGIRVDGARQESDTTFRRLCAYGVVLYTTLPAAQLQVVANSEYIGYPDHSARAKHLALARGASGGTQLFSVDHPARTLDVRGAPEACLYDHLHSLLAFLKELGHEVAIDVGDDALEAVADPLRTLTRSRTAESRLHPFLPFALLGVSWRF